MKKTALALSLFALAGVMTSIPALAGTLYSSGPTTSNYDAWNISNDAVTDQFTVAQAGDVTSISFEVWLHAGDSLSSVDWSFGNTQYGAEVDSGAATSLTATALGTNGHLYTLESETFTIPTLDLGAQTYWFTLAGAVDALNDPAYWDQNNGSSNGYTSSIGSISSYDCTYNSDCNESGGETFTLSNSAVAATPEPSSFLLLGSGLAGIAGMIRRKLKA